MPKPMFWFEPHRQDYKQVLIHSLMVHAGYLHMLLRYSLILKQDTGLVLTLPYKKAYYKQVLIHSLMVHAGYLHMLLRYSLILKQDTGSVLTLPYKKAYIL